jgi:hypothetical protein
VGSVGGNREGRRREVLIVAGHDPDRLLPRSASYEAEAPWVSWSAISRDMPAVGSVVVNVGLEQVTSEWRVYGAGRVSRGWVSAAALRSRWGSPAGGKSSALWRSLPL